MLRHHMSAYGRRYSAETLRCLPIPRQSALSWHVKRCQINAVDCPMGFRQAGYGIDVLDFNLRAGTKGIERCPIGIMLAGIRTP